MWQAFLFSCVSACRPLHALAMKITKPKDIKLTEQALGGLSSPSKMPCFSFNLPAKRCNMGSKLRAIKGSVCFSCYALKGRYGFPAVQAALERRFKLVEHALADPIRRQAWILDFAKVLNWYARNKGMHYFRWHDSGDLMSVEHLRAINAIAFNAPSVRFWLPTREKGLVSEFLSKGERFNENLTVRLSAPMVDADMPALPAHVEGQVKTSLVFRAAKWAEVYDRPENKFACPSSLQANACQDCRACWLSALPVVYKAH